MCVYETSPHMWFLLTTVYHLLWAHDYCLLNVFSVYVYVSACVCMYVSESCRMQVNVSLYKRAPLSVAHQLAVRRLYVYRTTDDTNNAL